MVDNCFVVVSLLSFWPSFLECGGGDGGEGAVDEMDMVASLLFIRVVVLS